MSIDNCRAILNRIKENNINNPEIDNLEKEINSLEKYYNYNIEELEKEKSILLDNFILKDNDTNYLYNINKEYENKIEEQKKEYENKINEQKKEYENKIKEQKKELTKITEMSETYYKELDECRKKINKIENKFLYKLYKKIFRGA